MRPWRRSSVDGAWGGSQLRLHWVAGGGPGAACLGCCDQPHHHHLLLHSPTPTPLTRRHAHLPKKHADPCVCKNIGKHRELFLCQNHLFFLWKTHGSKVRAPGELGRSSGIAGKLCPALTLVGRTEGTTTSSSCKAGPRTGSHSHYG